MRGIFSTSYSIKYRWFYIPLFFRVFMKWYAINGGWRKTDEKVRLDVERIVTDILYKNDCIVTGGAMGVDYIATDTVINRGDPSWQLKIYLPVRFDIYKDHLHQATKKQIKGVPIVRKERVDKLLSQLDFLQRVFPGVIRDDTSFTDVNPDSYYGRIRNIVDDCDEMFAFHINGTEGTQFGINLAREQGKPVHVWTYNVP